MDELRGGFHLAARDAKLIQQAQFPPEGGAIDFAAEKLAVTRDGS